MGKPLLRMDVSSVRSLMTLVVQLHTIIIFAQALSQEGRTKTKPKSSTNSTNGGPVTNTHVPCCLNGGLCVLGSFCHCPKNFYGRYCEHELKKTPCGHVSHGSWVKAGCNLCRCFDGHMTCLPRAFDGCDDKPETEDDDVNPWDYKDDMVVISSGDDTAAAGATSHHDDSYDDDYYDSSHRSSSSSGGRNNSGASSAWLMVVPCVVWTSVGFFSVGWTWFFGWTPRRVVDS